MGDIKKVGALAGKGRSGWQMTEGGVGGEGQGMERSRNGDLDQANI